MSEFLKHFEMFEKYLQDIYDQSAEGKPDKNVYRNQIFIMDCIKNGLVANPNLIFCIAEPSLARTYPPSNLQFFSENLAKDSNQAEAVKKIVGTKNMMVIQGPPGAGKTTVIVEAIRQIKKLHPKSKVLLTSTTHVAVDNVIKKLMDTNLSLARLRNKDDVKKDQSKQALLKLDIDYILEDLIKNNKLVKGYSNTFSK